MSVWTHVSGCIRIDSAGEDRMPLLYEKFGKTCPEDGLEMDFEECEAPCGSEGSVQYGIERAGDENSSYWGLVYIWGDLRDFDDAKEVHQWLLRACKGETIRGCAVMVDIEYGKRYVIYDKNNEILMKEIT